MNMSAKTAALLEYEGESIADTKFAWAVDVWYCVTNYEDYEPSGYKEYIETDCGIESSPAAARAAIEEAVCNASRDAEGDDDVWNYEITFTGFVPFDPSKYASNGFVRDSWATYIVNDNMHKVNMSVARR